MSNSRSLALPPRSPGAELAQDGGVEARVGELQRQGEFPVDPAAHGIGGLGIRETLGELHHGDEGELGWGVGGLTGRGKELGKLGIGVNRAERLAHAHVGIALGKGGTRNLNGVLGDHVDERGT